MFHGDRQADRQAGGKADMKKITVACCNFADSLRKGKNRSAEGCHVLYTYLCICGKLNESMNEH